MSDFSLPMVPDKTQLVASRREKQALGAFDRSNESEPINASSSLALHLANHGGFCKSGIIWDSNRERVEKELKEREDEIKDGGLASRYLG